MRVGFANKGNSESPVLAWTGLISVIGRSSCWTIGLLSWIPGSKGPAAAKRAGAADEKIQTGRVPPRPGRTRAGRSLDLDVRPRLTGESARVGRVVRRGLPGVPGLEYRGGRLRDSDRVDGATLMGRHKEIVCPQCDYVYTVNADREVELSGGDSGGGQRIKTGMCENCRFRRSSATYPAFG